MEHFSTSLQKIEPPYHTQSTKKHLTQKINKRIGGKNKK